MVKVSRRGVRVGGVPEAVAITRPPGDVTPVVPPDPFILTTEDDYAIATEDGDQIRGA
jgi:hypothetical protein